MSNTYSQISIHAVFTVKGRQNVITKEWRDDLHKYISGIITGNGATSLAVGRFESMSWPLAFVLYVSSLWDLVLFGSHTSD